MAFPLTRLRRLRHHQHLRDLVTETRLHSDQLILPLFVRHGKNIKNPIASLPGHFQFSVDQLAEEVKTLQDLRIKSVLLFGIPADKDALGQDAYAEDGIIQSAIAAIKKAAPNLLVMTDVCFCEYTDHGHCGVVIQNGDQFHIDNDQTLALLQQQAVSHAQAGVDVIAPSGMMDGMVAAIRKALDAAAFAHIPILSYSVKYASAMYGPFRDAAEGAPKFGDRHSHQMNVANSEEALRECLEDIREGADMLMVKPAHTYLDIISRVKKTYPELPLGAYHTSGEYVMVKAAAAKGWLDEKQAALEVLTAIKRAGADFIITYFAKEVAKALP